MDKKTRRRSSLPLVGFIGGYLIDAGALTLPDLDRALERQLKLGAQGRIVRLDDVLLELKLVTADQLMQAVARQAADLYRLRQAQRADNKTSPKNTKKARPRGDRAKGVS